MIKYNLRSFGLDIKKFLHYGNYGRYIHFESTIPHKRNKTDCTIVTQIVYS